MSAAQLLRDEAGLDAVHAGEIGLSAATDAEILEVGRRDSRVVITLDADFHALLAVSGAAGPSAVRLRVEGLRARGAMDLILEVAQTFSRELVAGAVVTVHAGRMRIRALPLLPELEA